MSFPLVTMLKSVDSSTKMRYMISEWMGFGGLLVFSFFSLLSIAGANIGLSLMLFAILLSPMAYSKLIRQPVFWLSIAMILYVVCRAFFATLDFPEDFHKIIEKQTRSWIFLCLFFIPAWWISRSNYRMVISFGLMLSGFLLGGLFALDIETLHHIMQGERSGFHFGKPIIFGFHCAVGMLGMVSLIHYMIIKDQAHIKPRWLSALLLTLAGAALLLFMQGLIVSQSRGVWLALLIALPLTLILLRRNSKISGKHERYRWFYLFGGMALLLSSTLAMHWGTITERLFFERNELGIFVTQGLEHAPLNSSIYRLHLWKLSVEKTLEKPLLGWGPGTTQILITQEDQLFLQDPKSGFGYDHFHNAYLELLSQLGLIGLLFVLAIVWLLLFYCFNAYRNGRLSKALFVFFIGNFLLIAVYSLTDFRHLHWNWRFYWMILAGASFSLCFSHSSRALMIEKSAE